MPIRWPAPRSRRGFISTNCCCVPARVWTRTRTCTTPTLARSRVCTARPSSLLCDPAVRYDYRAEQGAIPALDGALGGAALLALRDGGLDDPAHWPALKRLLRAQLAWHFGDRPLKSRALFRALAGRAQPEPDSA